MKQYGIYEVQKFGTTLEYTKRYAEAEAAFLGASPGGVTLMHLDTGTAKKVVLRRR